MGRLGKALSIAGLGSATAFLAAAGGASWYYANRITEPPNRLHPVAPRPEDRVEVIAWDAARQQVRVQGPDAARPGIWGLSGTSAYAQLGRVVAVEDDDQVIRQATSMKGDFVGGEAAVLDTYAYPPDPTVLGLDVDEAEVDGPLGPLPSWRFPADSDTWAVMVHGRSAERHEAFRLVPTLHDLGVTALVISYRNDGTGPPSPDGHSHLGATEWEDVEAAVLHALANGARQILLVGYSMGGACVANFLRLSPHDEAVCGLVLEAPVLDWGPVIRRAAVERGLPPAVLPLLLPTSMAVASLRAGIDWQRMQHLDDPDIFTQPKLLIHGDADRTVPVELADALAEARPDIIRYLRVNGAGHVQAWNYDHEAVERELREFVTENCGVTAADEPARRRSPRR